MVRITPPAVCCAALVYIATPIARVVASAEHALLGWPTRFALKVTARTWKRSAAGVLVGVVTAILFGAIDVLWPAVAGVAYAAFVAYYAVATLFLFAVFVLSGRVRSDVDSDPDESIELGTPPGRRAGANIPRGAFSDDAIPGCLIGLLLFFDFATAPSFDTAYLVATACGAFLAMARCVAHQAQ